MFRISFVIITVSFHLRIFLAITLQVIVIVFKILGISLALTRLLAVSLLTPTPMDRSLLLIVLGLLFCLTLKTLTILITIHDSIIVKVEDLVEKHRRLSLILIFELLRLVHSLEQIVNLLVNFE